MNARNQNQRKAAGQITQQQAQRLLAAARMVISGCAGCRTTRQDDCADLFAHRLMQAAIADIEGTNDNV